MADISDLNRDPVVHTRTYGVYEAAKIELISEALYY